MERKQEAQTDFVCEQEGGGRKRRGHGWTRNKTNKKKKTALSVDDFFASIYYDPVNPASFSAPAKLLAQAKKTKGREKLKLSQARDWLHSQPAYTLNRDSKQRFLKRKVVVSGKGVQYQADLADVSAIKHFNDGYTFILTVIDCFSRLATAIPIKNKTAESVASALKLAFTHLGGPPLKLQTDDGKEFKNWAVRELLEECGNVKWFSTSQLVKAQIVERFNRTLKEKLQKYYSAKGTLRYVDVLKDVLKGYNTSKHSTFKKIFSPEEVTAENENFVFELQYRKYLSERVAKPKFAIGDLVRISAYRPTFFKKTSQQNFTTELFKISDVCEKVNPPTYSLSSLNDSEAITGRFYADELQRVLL